MVLYRYVKSETRSQGLEPSNWLKILPIFSIILGLILISSVVYPVLSYQLLKTPRFQSNLLSPLANSTSFSPVVLGEEMDLTRISNWFPSAPKQVKISSRITDYALTIPKLRINEAAVKIGGENLGISLIHYGGTTLPGEAGNTVVFGHSVLPHLFNPHNYLTIFSTLPTLKTGDAIYVNYDGIEYKYRVFEMIEVGPNDVSILGQRYDRSILTLVTCVPPGTYWRRLAVKARLEKV